MKYQNHATMFDIMLKHHLVNLVIYQETGKGEEYIKTLNGKIEPFGHGILQTKTYEFCKVLAVEWRE